MSFLSISAGQFGLGRKSLWILIALSSLLFHLKLDNESAQAADTTTTYVYDESRPGAYNVGKLTSVSSDAANIRYDHDERGNIVSQRWEVDGQTYVHSYSYALSDHILRRMFADGDVIPSASETYQYDGAGFLKSIPGLITNVSRNASFDPIATTYGNGITETRSYDPNRQWLMSITAQSGQTTLFEESYTRSDKGLITDVTSNRANGDWQYGYDTADRLTSATNLNDNLLSQTFQYDAADNITNNSAVGSYTYPTPTSPRPHAVTQAGSHTYSYDSNGNMTAGAGRTITYDGENRPVSITYNGQTTAFVYGPDGRRLKKIVGGETTLFLGADEEITPAGFHIKHPLADVRKIGTSINWLHRDHLSSVKLMSDASGTVISENFFRPYGELAEVQIPPNGVPRESKGWIGERNDIETGLVYLNSRYFDPITARFISPDWFDADDLRVGTNRYAYAANNPIWLKDPSGNWTLGGGTNSYTAKEDYQRAAKDVRDEIARLEIEWKNDPQYSDGHYSQNIDTLRSQRDIYSSRARLSDQERIDSFRQDLVGTASEATTEFATGFGAAAAGGAAALRSSSWFSRFAKSFDLSGHRTKHILNRHRWGAGKPGKTEFPARWSDNEILYHVSDVATDPKALRGLGKWNSPYAIGTRDGIEIRVDFYPNSHPKYSGQISTAYPINVPANP